jgi:hypothetical protein
MSKSNMNNKTIVQRLTEIEREAKILRRIRLLQNELLCNGAYSNKNESEQLLKFEKSDVPQWEIDIIKDSYIVRKELAHNSLRKLKELIDDMKLKKQSQEKPNQSVKELRQEYIKKLTKAT